jgi:hypothetical protein
MFVFGFEIPCIFGSEVTLPNVFLKPYLAFPEHRPSGQQGGLKPVAKRGYMGAAGEALLFKNWTDTTTVPCHPS